MNSTQCSKHSVMTTTRMNRSTIRSHQTRSLTLSSMWIRLSIVLIMAILMLTLVVLSYTVSQASVKSSRRLQVADEIADICIDNWETYGRLPSIAVGQAFVESGLGSGPNLFGVNGHSGRSVYGSTIGYLECLRNEYFRSEGAFVLDREEHLSIIMKGGRYCEGQHPGGSYYSNVLNSIYRYNWDAYDSLLIKKLKAKEGKEIRRKHQSRPFKIVLSDSIPEGHCSVDPEYIKTGSTVIYPGGIIEASYSCAGLKNTVIIGRKGVIFPQKMDGTNFFDTSLFEVDLEVIEDAKG